MSQPIYALLIGINQYASTTVPDLGGCVHDVTAMSGLLRTQFGVAADQIKLLTNEQATHQAIHAAFQNHLLAPLATWAAQGKKGEKPALLFYFSGHGSQASSVTKASALDQTLVPHDSRTAGVYDIKDWELGQWLAQLTTYTDNVTVILDCCHSGSGTRTDKKQITDVRGCPTDERPQPAPDGTIAATQRTVMRGAIDLSQQRQHLDYVLIAACRNDQKAREETVGTTPPQRHGILTYWLIDALRHMPPHQPLSYRELYEQVRHRVTSAHQDQMPQCEGDRDRLFLGGVRPVQGRWLSVIAVSDGLIWVDSGQAQGLSIGTILHVYPPETQGDVAPTQAPLAVLEVDEVEAVRSGCRRTDAAATPLPPGSRALVHSYGTAPTRTKIGLDVTEGWFMKTIRERLLRDDIRPRVEIALPGERATLRVAVVGETLQLQSGDQQIYQSYKLRDLNPMRRPFQTNDLDPVVRDLLLLLSQAQVRAIASTQGSEIASAISVKLERLISPDSTGAPQTAPVDSDADHNHLLRANEPFVLSLTNGYSQPLYFTVLELGYRGDVTRLYPQIAGANEAVAAGRTLMLGRLGDLKMRLPAGIPTVQETLKVIATTEQANFDYLLQGEIAAPQKPAPVMRGGQRPPATETPVTRSYKLGGGALPEDKWGTVEVRVKVVSGAIGQS